MMIWIPLLFQQPKFLGLQVVLVLLLVLVHAIPESPLSVSVNVHLHDACLNGITDVFQRGARTSVENERHRLVALASQLLLHKMRDNKTCAWHWLKHELVHDRLLISLPMKSSLEKLDSNLSSPLTQNNKRFKQKVVSFDFQSLHRTTGLGKHMSN